MRVERIIICSVSLGSRRAVFTCLHERQQGESQQGVNMFHTPCWAPPDIVAVSGQVRD